LPPGGDPAVLEFEIELSRPGFLCASFVFGSDEYPHWIDQPFNDTFVILVKGPCTPQGSPGENLATFIRNGAPENFSLQALKDCEDLFRENNMSPASVAAFPNTRHDIPGAQYYDHEFGGFSAILSRETAKPLAPATYTIKFVIEDVDDRLVDAALFLPEHSLKLFALQQGDYNGDGIVDSADYYVWTAHFGQSPATFYDGDGTGNGVVDAADYDAWRGHQGQTGNADRAADLDRNGCVGQGDLDAVLLHWGLDKCAAPFEGGATGDGAVKQPDLDQVLIHWGEGVCGQALMAGGGGWEGVQAQLDAAGIAVDVEQFAAAREELAGSSEASRSPSAADLARIPESPDLNGDGQVDADEIARLTKIVYEAYFGASDSPASVSTSADEPVSSADADVASASTAEPEQVLPVPESMPEDEFVLDDEAVPAEEAPADELPPTPPPGPFGPPLPVPPGAPR
jgi:hypothetical protein